MPTRSPARPALIRMLASVTRRAKRSGRIAASGRPAAPSPSALAISRALRERDGAVIRPPASCAPAAGDTAPRPLGGTGGASPWRSSSSSRRRCSSPSSSSGPSSRAFAPSPSTHEIEPARVRVAGLEDRLAVLLPLRGRCADLAVAPEVAFDLPRDPLADQDLARCRCSSPSCQSARLAYARGSKSAGRWKSCSAFVA